MQPLNLVGATDKYDVYVNVNGGGMTGQAGAIRHGIARALVLADVSYKPEIKKAGFLTRSPYEGAQEIRLEESSSRASVLEALIAGEVANRISKGSVRLRSDAFSLPRIAVDAAVVVRAVLRLRNNVLSRWNFGEPYCDFRFVVLYSTQKTGGIGYTRRAWAAIGVRKRGI